MRFLDLSALSEVRFSALLARVQGFNLGKMAEGVLTSPRTVGLCCTAPPQSPGLAAWSCSTTVEKGIGGPRSALAGLLACVLLSVLLTCASVHSLL